jgi:predicted dehydrogenase
VLRHQLFARGLREAVDRGKLGPVRFGHVTLVRGPATPDPGGSSAPATPSESPFPEMLDALDLLAWLVGVPVRTVFARACPLDVSDPNSRFVTVVVLFTNGGQGLCEAGWTTTVGRFGLTRVALIGEHGSAYHDGRQRDLVLGPAGARPLPDDQTPDPAIPPDQAANTRYSLALAMAAHASLDRGEPVTVPASE